MATLPMSPCDAGSVFDQIQSMKELRELNLEGSGLTGTWAAVCPARKGHSVLTACSSLPAGPVPSCVGELKNLEVLALANNSLSGPLPELNGLHRLRIIRLGFNKFEGLCACLPLPLPIQPFHSLQRQLLTLHFITTCFVHFQGRSRTRGRR